MRLAFDEYTLDVARRELWRGKERVAIEPQVFDLLLYLVQNRDRLVGRDELLRAVWEGRTVSESAINNRVNAARRAIGDSGAAQRLIRTMPRKGFRFIGAVGECGPEPAPPVLSENGRRRVAARTLAIAAASALAGAAVAALLLRTAGTGSVPADATGSGRAPVQASADDRPPTLAAVPFARFGDGVERFGLSVPLGKELATEFLRKPGVTAQGRGESVDAPRTRRGPGARRIADSGVDEDSGKTTTNARLADTEVQTPAEPVAATQPSTPPIVPVSAPAPSAQPPYISGDPWKAFARNPYFFRYRLEEDRFARVSCSLTRVAPVSGGSCLRGYHQSIGPAFGGAQCEMAFDATIYTAGNLSVEAAVLVFDAYKLAAVGYPARYCQVRSYTGYDQADFQDMNRVTRRGANWHDLRGAGDEKSIAFRDGPHDCVAVRRPGPAWQDGYGYMLTASVCRTDGTGLQPGDIVRALAPLQVRRYDPADSLRRAAR